MTKMKDLWDRLYTKRYFIILVGFLLINLSVWIDYLKGKQGFAFGPFQTTVLGIGIIILLTGVYLQYPVKMMGLFKGTCRITFLVGIGLYCLNVSGVFIPSRDPEINTLEFRAYDGRIKDIEYNKSEVFNAIDKHTNESNGEYAYRLVDLVYTNTLHFFEPSQPGKYHQRVPIYENYILFFRSYLQTADDVYEFCDPHKALDRGIGLCSQFSLLLAGTLEQNGIAAEIYVLSGHVVTEAVINPPLDQRWVLDADYGVVVESDLKTLENNPEIVVDAYNRFGYSEEASKRVAEIYGSEGNYIPEIQGYCQEETQSYVYKWVLPLLLMTPLGLLKLGTVIRKFT